MGDSIHSVTILIAPGSFAPSFRAHCADSAADCHYVCAEGCESWGPLVRNEAGAVMGHECAGHRLGDPLHRMEHVEDCTFVEWQDAADEWTESLANEVEVDVPVEFTFNGDSVTWEAL